VVEHAVAYATFPNLGKAVAPHAALEVRTGTGELVWRFDRDGKRPEQVIAPKVALDMRVRKDATKKPDPRAKDIGPLDAARAANVSKLVDCLDHSERACLRARLRTNRATTARE